MKSQREHLLRSLRANIRYDSRKLDEYRPVTVTTGVVGTSEGSAHVKCGNTEVIAGVKLFVDKPYPDTPEDGAIMMGAELLPLSSSEYELGPPQEKAIELARIVDRGIRESKAIDTKKLCLTAGEKVWIVSVDICTINDDGGLIDVSGIATLAALKDTVFPKLNKVEESYRIDYKEKTKQKLPMVKAPIPVTVYKVGDTLLLDPTAEEEELVDARLTVTSIESGHICALQKGGETPLSDSEIKKMVELALLKAKELRKHV